MKLIITNGLNLETGETENHLEKIIIFKGFCHLTLFLDTVCIQKCLETEKTTKSLEKIIIFKGSGTWNMEVEHGTGWKVERP